MDGSAAAIHNEHTATFAADKEDGLRILIAFDSFVNGRETCGYGMHLERPRYCLQLGEHFCPLRTVPHREQVCSCVRDAHAFVAEFAELVHEGVTVHFILDETPPGRLFSHMHLSNGHGELVVWLEITVDVDEGASRDGNRWHAWRCRIWIERADRRRAIKELEIGTNIQALPHLESP